MNTIKIYLAQDGSIANLQKDFALYQYEYQNKLLNVFVPTSICANQFVGGDVTEGCACQIKMTSTNSFGVVKETKAFYMRYVKTMTYNGVEYALFERLLPYAFTIYSGVGVNAPTLTISVVNIKLVEDENNNIVPQLISITNTQTCSLDVNASTQVVSDEPNDPSDMDALFGMYSELVDNLNLKQDIALSMATINAISAIINGLAPTEVEPSFIELFTRAVTNAGNIGDINSDISDINNEIDALKQTIATGVRIIGTMTATDTLPTQQQMDDFRTAQGYTDATNGDIIIIQLTKTDATNELWVANYDTTTELWTTIKMTFLESASNGDKGIVEGTADETTSTNNILFDIQNGKIVDALVSYGGSWVSIKTRLDTIQQYINDYLLNGTYPVPKASADANNNNIQATYLTKVDGASKEYVQDYASPKMLQDLYYLDFTENELVDELVDNTDRSVSIQDANTDYELGTFLLDLPQDILIGAKNGFHSKINIETATTRDLVVKMLVYYELASDEYGTDYLLGAYASNSTTFTANTIRTMDIEQLFTQLSDPITLEKDDRLKVVFKVEPTTTASETILFIANDTYPSISFIDKQAYVEYVVNTNDYNALSNKPIIELDLASESVSDLSTNVIYQHTGLTDSTYTTGWLYIKRNSLDVALDTICKQYVKGAKLGASDLVVDSDFNIVIPTATTTLYDMQDIDTITDSVPTASSTNLVESGGVYSALASKTDLTDIAPAYDSTSTYAVGDIVTYGGDVYKCSTAIGTAEAWDSTHWTQKDVKTLISENVPNLSNYVDLTNYQTISGDKTFTGGVMWKPSSLTNYFSLGGYQSSDKTALIRLSQKAKIQYYYSGYKDFIDISSTTGKVYFRSPNTSLPIEFANGLNATLRSDNATYGIVPPDTTSFTANKTIDTTENIAPTYDSTSTYAVGDVVIYNGALYQCNTAITTAEAFDNAKWTSVDVKTLVANAGGGTPKYLHYIYMFGPNENNIRYCITYQLITDSSTPYTTSTILPALLAKRTNQDIYMSCSGYIKTSNNTMYTTMMMVIYASAILAYSAYPTGGQNEAITTHGVAYIDDYVEQI